MSDKDEDNVFAFPASLSAKGYNDMGGPRDPLGLAYYPHSDSGLARRFVARFGDVFRFVDTQGWYHFNGKHWKQEGAEFAAMNAAREVTERIKDEAAAVEMANATQRRRAIAASGDEAQDPENSAALEYASKLRAYATKAGDLRHLRGMLAVAQGDLLAQLSDFDPDPLVLNCQNGTVRFIRDPEGPATVRLDPHEPADMITQISPFAFNPHALAPQWLAHLAKMQPDEDVRGYLRRALGYTATGMIGEQCYFVHQGRGGDGKSVTLNTCRRALGGYAATADVQAFLKQQNGKSADSASPALASLAGDIRLVSLSEPPRKSEFNDGLLKIVTGGGEVRTRHLRRDLFSYRPRYKLHFECNARPRIPGMDEGIWRRTKLIKWPMKLAREEWDTELEDRIFAQEGEGVLRWLVEAACEYLDAGLGEPASMRKAREDWRQNSNTIGEWLNECVLLDADATCSQRALYESYKLYCEDNSYLPSSPPTFYDQLDNLAIEKTGKKDPNDRNYQRKGARLLTAQEREGENEAKADRKTEKRNSIDELGDMPF